MLKLRNEFIIPPLKLGYTSFAKRNGENIQFNNIDLIVVSTGMKSYIPFKPDPEIPAYFVGDANRVSKAEEAIHDAYKLALSL